MRSSLRSYPDGRQGVALLVLRNALAVLAVYLGAERWMAATPRAAAVVLLLAVGCLCLGLLTTWVAVLCGVAAAVGGGDWGRGLAALVLAGVVVLLGPGSYSVDAVRYGRRRRVFPPEG